MRQTLISSGALTALIVILAHAATTITRASKSPRPDAEDEAAILETLKQMNDGWKSRDGEMFAKPFANDADYVVVNGMHLQGRKAIEEGHRALFARIPEADPKESESVRNEVTFRFLRPDVAIVHTVGFGTVHSIATLVLTKGAQGWQIAALQRTAIVHSRTGT